MFKCFDCTDKHEQLPDLLQHIEDEHGDAIPKDQSVGQYYYMRKTGKPHGSCVVCKNKTKWNEETSKYHRFCTNPRCKERYREVFVNRMIGVHGVATKLNDPEHQKKMLANRSISGKYKWRDGKEFTYTGTYEKDFLQFLDVFMNFDSADIMSPSPHTYYYMYEGKKKFYIPDFFIASLNLEIEVKDGGRNPNNHHKIQAVDKVKEKLKDDVLTSQKNFSYIKIVDKEYDNFFDLLMQMKADIQKDGEPRQVFDLADNKGLVVKGPVKESLYVEYEELNRDNLMAVIEGIESASVLDSIIESNTFGDAYREDLSKYRDFIKYDGPTILGDMDQYITNEVIPSHRIDDYLKQKGIKLSQVRRPGFVRPYMDNLFINILESLDHGDIEGCLTTINHDFRSALTSECDNEEAINQYARDAKAMQYYLRLLASKLDKQRLLICDISKRIEDIVTEALVVEGQEAYPVYVLLTHTGTMLSNAIKTVTKNAYSHASISFDASLNEMYSFGRKYKNNPLIGTFVREDIQTGLYEDVAEHATYSLYVTFVSKAQMEAMKARLETFKQPSGKFKYSFIGLINYKFGKESDSVDSFFCSQFVDHVLSAGRPYFDRHSSLVEPTDFAKHKDFYFVSKGKLKNYDVSDIENRVTKVSQKAKFTNSNTSPNIAYIGLTKTEALERRQVDITTDSNVIITTSVQDLINQTRGNDKITHYSVLTLSELKKRAVVLKTNDGYSIEAPLSIKIKNINRLI